MGWFEIKWTKVHLHSWIFFFCFTGGPAHSGPSESGSVPAFAGILYAFDWILVHRGSVLIPIRFNYLTRVQKFILKRWLLNSHQILELESAPVLVPDAYFYSFELPIFQCSSFELPIFYEPNTKYTPGEIRIHISSYINMPSILL